MLHGVASRGTRGRNGGRTPYITLGAGSKVWGRLRVQRMASRLDTVPRGNKVFRASPDQGRVAVRNWSWNWLVVADS